MSFKFICPFLIDQTHDVTRGATFVCVIGVNCFRLIKIKCVWNVFVM